MQDSNLATWAKLAAQVPVEGKRRAESFGSPEVHPFGRAVLKRGVAEIALTSGFSNAS